MTDLKVKVPSENDEKTQVAVSEREAKSTAEQQFTDLMHLDSDVYENWIAKSKSLEKAERLISLNASYKEFTSVDEGMTGVFLGTRTIKIKDKEDNLNEHVAVAWLNDGKTYLNAGVSLVNEILSSGILPGTTIEIVYKGKEKDVKVYDVFLLKVEG